MLRYALPALLPLLLLISGCASWLPGADRVEVRQGNILDAEEIERLEIGMTRAQVREAIGEPILREAFNPNRWDYIYYLTDAGRDTGDIQRLSLFFEGDEVVRIDDAYTPPPPPEPGDVPDMPDEEAPTPGQPAPEQPAPQDPGPRNPGPGDTMPSPPSEGGLGSRGL
jgi:outer membrane protein assembly factor BamE